jgi:hypothetical protein
VPLQAIQYVPGQVLFSKYLIGRSHYEICYPVTCERDLAVRVNLQLS